MEWVLYIDDDPDDRDMFLEICEEVQPGIECLVANGGIEAFNLLNAREAPLCIYLDINMPGMNGVEVLKILKAKTKLRDVPVIMLSTSMTAKLISETKGIGAADHLTKPSSYNGFHTMLKACLRQHFKSTVDKNS